MAGGGDDLTLLDGLAAHGADLVAGVAVLRAGSGLRAHQLGLVAQSGDNLALLDGLAADGADLVAGIAIFRAGGGLRTYQLGLVAQSGDGQGLQGGLVLALSIAEQLAAHGAHPVSLDAVFGAGGGDLRHGGQLVTVGGNGLGPDVGIGDAVQDHLGGIGADAALQAGAAGGDLAGDLGVQMQLLMPGIHGAGKFGIGAEIVVPGPHRLAVHMTVLQLDVHRAGGADPLLAGLAVPILIEHPVGAAGDVQPGQIQGHGDLRILRRQGLGGELHIVRHVPGHAVGQQGRHLHAGAVEGLADLIDGALRLPGDLQGGDAAAQPHHIGRVVLEIDVALAVHNGAADGVLGLCAAGGEQHIPGLDGDLAGIAVIGLHGGVGVVHLGHAGLIPQDPQLAGGIVVEEVHIRIAVLVLIGRGQQTAGLGIALGGDCIGDGEALQIHHGHVVAGIGPELAGAGHADVGPAVVDHRCGGGHGRRVVIVAAVVQVQAVQGPLHEGAVLVGADLIQVAALGGEVIGVGGGVIAHTAAQVAHVGGLQLVQQNAGLGIQGQHGAVARGIAAVAVVGGHQDEVFAGIGPGPVKPVVGIGPGGQLGLLGLGGVLIGNVDAHEVGLLGFGVPEAGIDIPVAVGDGAVGLTAQGIGIHPQGLQALGVEGLDAASAEGHEDHAVGIGGGVDGEGGAGDHGALAYHRAGLLVNLQQLVPGIGVEIPACNNGAGGGAGAVALAHLVGPHQHRVLGGDGGGGADHAVVVAVRPEQGPVAGLENVVVGALRGLVQLHGDVLAVLPGDHVQLLAHIAAAGHHQGIGSVGVQGIGAGLAGQDPLAVDVAGQEHRGVGGVGGDGGLHRRQLVDPDGIGLRYGGGLAVGNGDGDGLRLQGGVQGNVHRPQDVGPVVRVIGQGLAPVAAGHGNGHVRVQLIAGQGAQSQLYLRHPLAQGRCVIQHQLVEGFGCIVLLVQGQGAAVVVRQLHGVQGHDPVGGDEIALIEGDAAYGLGLGHLQLHGVAMAAGGPEVGHGAVAIVLGGQHLFIQLVGEVGVIVTVIDHGGHIGAVCPGPVQEEGGVVGLHGEVILVDACAESRGHGIGDGLGGGAALGVQALEPVLHNGGGHLHRQPGGGLHGGGGVEIAVLGGDIGVAVAGNQGIHIGGAGLLPGGDHRPGAVGQLHRHILVMLQGHQNAFPLFHQHRISDGAALEGQLHGDDVLPLAVLLAAGQGHVYGSAALGRLPGNGQLGLGAQGGGGNGHRVLGGGHGIAQGFLVKVQLQPGGGVGYHQVRQAGGAQNVQGIGLVLLVSVHGIPGLQHHVPAL